MRSRMLCVIVVALAVVTLSADEGMWRIGQLPVDTIANRYGVKLTPRDLERLQNAAVRISSGGTGTFASPNGLILTNHHVALDCIRTSTLAEQEKGGGENLIERGFTARMMSEELPCRRFRVQIERSSRDVTTELNLDVKSGMSMAQIQQVRQARRGEIERACTQEKGASFTCSVVDFNSGAFSQLIVYEDFNDIRLVYAPEKQLGYFGGDEMNFRFPRYVSDISILRAYVGRDGSHGEFNAANVPYRPAHYLRVTLGGVKEGDVTFVAGNPGNTNRYRISESAVYNTSRGMPRLIQEFQTELALLRTYASEKPENQVLLQERIFGLANTLKYTQDVLAALESSDVVKQQQERERQFMEFLRTRRPDLVKEYETLFADHKKLYATTVEANADLDAALDWLEKASVVSYATTLYEFAQERAKPSDRDRDPQFQERFWNDVRQALTVDEPLVSGLEEDVLAIGFERALKLPADRQVPAVQSLVRRAGTSDPRALARAVTGASTVAKTDVRKMLVDAAAATFTASTDPAIVFARDLLPTIQERRARTRVLNETLLETPCTRMRTSRCGSPTARWPATTAAARRCPSPRSSPTCSRWRRRAATAAISRCPPRWSTGGRGLATRRSTSATRTCRSIS
ncbi:MAG: hypothetical protein DMF88_21030 [Acidobacteria bacterium]|nr:MAG: hypothetical protein DMF88_21030 [Acidobacteriota bacterium]